MPELPDVARLKQYFDATSLHQRIRKSSVRDERIVEGVSRQRLYSRLKRAEFEQTTRHGKFLFAGLTGGEWLVLHFGMSGELHYFQEGNGLPEYTKVVFMFENGRSLAYVSRRMLGRVGLTDDLDAFLEAEDLGPDALAEDLTRERFRRALAGRRGALKPLLMSQSVVAGIGNIYADEILFQTRLRPEVRADRLSDEDVDRLYAAMRRVLRTAVRHGAEAPELPEGYLLPARDRDGPCPRCGGRLRTKTVSGRTAYYCPRCQKGPTA